MAENPPVLRAMTVATGCDNGPRPVLLAAIAAEPETVASGDRNDAAHQGRCGMAAVAVGHGPDGIPLFRREWSLARSVTLVEQMSGTSSIRLLLRLSYAARPTVIRQEFGPGHRTFGDN